MCLLINIFDIWYHNVSLTYKKSPIWLIAKSTILVVLYSVFQYCILWSRKNNNNNKKAKKKHSFSVTRKKEPASSSPRAGHRQFPSAISISSFHPQCLLSNSQKDQNLNLPWTEVCLTYRREFLFLICLTFRRKFCL